MTSFQGDLAETLEQMGGILAQAGKPDEAMKAFLSALKIAQKLVDGNPTVTDFQRRLADTHQFISRSQRAIGKPADAIESLERALEIQQKLANAHPTNTYFQLTLSETHGSIGVLLAATGKPDEAKKSLMRARRDRAEAGRRKSHCAQVLAQPGGEPLSNGQPALRQRKTR